MSDNYLAENIRAVGITTYVFCITYNIITSVMVIGFFAVLTVCVIKLVSLITKWVDFKVRVR